MILSAIFSQTSFASLRVFIDPGHGGSERGAVYNEIEEADLVLEISKEIQKLLIQHGGIEVALSRDRDLDLSLEERVLKAKQFHSDLFISLHANSGQNRRTSGAEFYFQNVLPPSEEILYLANLENTFQNNKFAPQPSEADNISLSSRYEISAILEDLRRQASMRNSHLFLSELLKIWPGKKATIRQAPFYVVSEVARPAVLLELGYLTNPQESHDLKSKSFQREIAGKIFDAVLSYQKKIDR